jgi:predicted nucleotidyltransferase
MDGDRPDISGALADLSRALDDAGCRYMVFGGIAVIARGVPRHTDDLDATVWGEDIGLERLGEALRAHAVEPRISDALAFARENQVLLLRHAPSGIDIDLTFGWLPFEREALEGAELLDLGGVRVPVARAEDLIIYKAVAWRDRDRSDVERLLTLHAGTIDLGRVRRVVGEFAEALESPERVGELEALIARVAAKPKRRPRTP